MSKIPAGVGPKLPQVVVLFGATGDLSQRKLLPGLFHLITAGFIHKCRIVGVSLDDMTPDDFRALAHKAIQMHHDHPPAQSDWPTLDAALDYVPIKQGPKALAAAVQRAAEVARRNFPTRQLPQRAAERGAVGGRDAGRGGPRQRLAGDHGKAVRDRPRERDGAQRRTAQGVRRGPDLPHRPFPRQGTGAEHFGLPLRQRAVRADLESQFHRSRADRRARDAGYRQSHRLLRAHRRLSRHGRDPPLPDPRLRGDGAADLAGPEPDQRGEEQGVPLADADRPRQCGARAVRRLP